jgi:hypothetical protein
MALTLSLLSSIWEEELAHLLFAIRHSVKLSMYTHRCTFSLHSMTGLTLTRCDALLNCLQFDRKLFGKELHWTKCVSLIQYSLVSVRKVYLH